MEMTKFSKKEELRNNIKDFFVSLGEWIKFFAKTIFRNKKAFIGSLILLIFIFIAIFGRLIFPYDGTTSFENMYLRPSPEHFLGTDGAGRDLFRMIIHGTRDVLVIAFYAAIITVGIGTLIGVVSGYIGGWVDRITGLFINVVMSIPTFPLLIIIAHFVTVKGNLALGFLLSIFAWPGLARAVRSQIISLKERDFIQICEVTGLSRAHIIFKELLPNVFSYIAINFISAMRGAITSSIGLMTIGAVTYEITNWGGIIITARASGAMSIPEARLCIIAPIVAIMLFQIGAILFSNGIDELVNPRLRDR
ncbi:MAG: ABC transporter permease [Bacilli bacterium]|jgi:peptide/nickel transport system permease protein